MIYNSLHSIKYKFARLWSIIYTCLRVNGSGVQHSAYKCLGIPVIERSTDSLIVWGKNLSMNNGLMGNRIGYNSPCVFRADGGSIFIGDNVGMSQTTIVAKSGGDVIIGNNVLIGGGAKLYSSDFHSVSYIDRRFSKIDKLHRKSAPIVIGDDCFIGAGTIILKGVNIGARTVVGAGSVVTKSLPSDCICGGNPCKVLRYLSEICDQ